MRVAALPARSRQLAASPRIAYLLSPPSILVLAMATLVFLVWPLGEFPVNDDWLYAQTVQALAERGQLALPAWGATTFALQAYWGALFVKLFGFSHSALRVSTLLLAAACVVGFYLLLCETLDSTRALLGALMLLFNPLFVHLAYSFMTDVPFLALAIWSLLCYTRALSGERLDERWLVIGSTFAAAGYLVRQLGAVLPGVALLAIALGQGWRLALRPRCLLAVLVPLAPAALASVYVADQRGLVREDALAWTLAFWSDQGVGLPGLILSRLTALVFTLALVALPLTACVLAGRGWRELHPWQWKLPAVTALVLAVGFGIRVMVFEQTSVLPFMKNVLTSRGFLGRDHYSGTLPESILVPEMALVLATVAAALGGGVVLVAATAALSRQTLRKSAHVALLFGLLSLIQILLYHEFIDRYLLVLLPSVVLLLLLPVRLSGSVHTLALAGVVVLGIWSVSWERDYLERRAALWRAGQTLVERGIPPEEIDGAFEWNGWFRGESAIQAAQQQSRGDRTGRQLQNSILQSLDLKRARWAVAYAPPVELSDNRVVAVVPYGRGYHAVAVQRS